LQTSETEVDFVNIEREKGMKRKQNGFADLYQWAEQQDDYWLEGVKIEFAEQMLAQMDALGISRKDLAQRLGVSPAYVTKILRGSTNFTLKSMVGIARALNCELHTYLQKKDGGDIGIEFNSANRHPGATVSYLPDQRPQVTVCEPSVQSHEQTHMTSVHDERQR